MYDDEFSISPSGFSFGDFSPQLETSGFDNMPSYERAGAGDSFPSLDSILKIGGGALNAFALLSQALGKGQAREPRLDRAPFSATPVGPSAPQNPETYRALLGRLQTRGIAPGTVSLDFYRNALPPDIADLPPEMLMQILYGGY